MMMKAADSPEKLFSSCLPT